MTAVVFPYYIMRHLEKEIERSKADMLRRIAAEYALNETELLDKYLTPASKTNIRISATDPQKAYNSDASVEALCVQTTKQGRPCRRSKCKGTEYCTIHLQWNARTRTNTK